MYLWFLHPVFTKNRLPYCGLPCISRPATCWTVQFRTSSDVGKGAQSRRKSCKALLFTVSLQRARSAETFARRDIRQLAMLGKYPCAMQCVTSRPANDTLTALPTPTSYALLKGAAEPQPPTLTQKSSQAPMWPALAIIAGACTTMPSAALAALVAALTLTGVAAAQEIMPCHSDRASGSGPSRCAPNFCQPNVCQPHRGWGTRVKESLHGACLPAPPQSSGASSKPFLHPRLAATAPRHACST